MSLEIVLWVVVGVVLVSGALVLNRVGARMFDQYK